MYLYYQYLVSLATLGMRKGMFSKAFMHAVDIIGLITTCRWG